MAKKRPIGEQAKARHPLPKLAYTVQEAAEATGISRSAIYEDMAADRLSFFKRGRHRLILHGELETYLHKIAERSRRALA